MASIDQVYEEYRDTVFGYLYRLCGDGDLADELTQQTFYQAVRKWKQYRGDSGVQTWLCAIARNCYLTALRRSPTVPLDEEHTIAAPDFTAALMDRDMAMRAQKALHHLPEPYREVFTLRVFAELSYAEIGQLFEKSENWVRVTYYRARVKLNDALKEDTQHGEQE